MSKPWVADPHPTIDERLEDLRLRLGDGDSGRRTYETVAAIVEVVDRKALAEAQLRHAGDFEKYGRHAEHKYLDVVYWTLSKLHLAQALGLDRAEKPLEILDLGAGACHFGMIAQHYGHKVTALDLANPIYDEIAPILGVQRTIDRVDPKTPMTDFGKKFDLITAFMINFHNMVPRQGDKWYWDLEDWAYLYNDLISNQLNLPGRVLFGLNPEHTPDGRTELNRKLMELCDYQGAVVDYEFGYIDWTFLKPVAVSAIRPKRRRPKPRLVIEPAVPETVAPEPAPEPAVEPAAEPALEPVMAEAAVADPAVADLAVAESVLAEAVETEVEAARQVDAAAEARPSREEALQDIGRAAVGAMAGAGVVLLAMLAPGATELRLAELAAAISIAIPAFLLFRSKQASAARLLMGGVTAAAVIVLGYEAWTLAGGRPASLASLLPLAVCAVLLFLSARAARAAQALTAEGVTPPGKASWRNRSPLRPGTGGT